MEKKNSTHIQSLGTLQLVAIITVVLGHFWIKDSTYMNSVCVAFCFVYSGFFTALHHKFPEGYGMKEHLRFMWGKIAKLYPLHVLAIVLSIITIIVAWRSLVSPTVILAHLTLTSSWIPFSSYFFGVNPVAWFICDLFFLYLTAPLMVRWLRKVSVLWQAIIIIALLVIQYTVEYNSLLGAYHYYFLYQFPIARMLDFSAGIAIYNLTQTVKWQEIQSRLNASSATVIEACSIIAFFVLYYVGKYYIHAHCYRAFCASAPAIVAIFVPFILTNGCNGFFSRLLQFKLFGWFSGFTAEIYLLQRPYFMVEAFFLYLGYMPPTPVYFVIQMSFLFLLAWTVHRYYTIPLKKKLLGLYPGK